MQFKNFIGLGNGFWLEYQDVVSNEKQNCAFKKYVCNQYFMLIVGKILKLHENISEKVVLVLKLQRNERHEYISFEWIKSTNYLDYSAESWIEHAVNEYRIKLIS